jgi:hypothetical protein
MSTSRAVFRRRRAVAGFVLLALVIVVVLLIWRPGASQGETPVSSPAPTAVATSGTPAPTATSTPTPTPKVKAGAPCQSANVDVEALTDATTYGSGQDPQLSLSITNSGPKSCAIDAGTGKQLFTVTSGTETYWKSSDCQTDPTSKVILLLPGKTVTSTAISWDRTRSDPATCNNTRPAVPAGGASYHLQVSVDGIQSKTSKQFLLY